MLNDQLDLPEIDPGNYELLTEVARTASSVVWRAKSLLLWRDVAIKLMHVEPENTGRMIREARIASQLEHCNIVQIHAFGKWGEHLCLIMEFVDGESLRDRLSRKGSLADDPEQLATVFSKVFSAVRFAHEHGVIHRDIKPSNIMLLGEHDVKLVDFGIARHVEINASEKLTVTGIAIGTPLYMSPEQCSARPCDCRSDIYGLGAVLFQCICGRAPFEAECVYDVMYKHLHTPVEELYRELKEQAGDKMADLVCKCLAKDPDNRYQSVEDLSVDFDKAVSCIDKQQERPSGRAVFCGSLIVAISLALLLLQARYQTMNSSGILSVSSHPSPSNLSSIDLAFKECRQIEDSKGRMQEFRLLLDRSERKRCFLLAAAAAAELLVVMDKMNCSDADVVLVAERLKAPVSKVTAIPKDMDKSCFFYVPEVIARHGSLELALNCGTQVADMFATCACPGAAARLRYANARLLVERHMLDDAWSQVLESERLYARCIESDGPQTDDVHLGSLELGLLEAQIQASKGNMAKAEQIMRRLSQNVDAVVVDDTTRKAVLAAEIGYFYLVEIKSRTVGEKYFHAALRLSDDPAGQWRILLRKAHAYSILLDQAAVERVFNEMHELSPIPAGQRGLGAEYRDFEIHLALQSHRNSRARELIERQLAYCAEDPALMSYKGRAYWLLGVMLIHTGDDESALKNLKLGLACMPSVTKPSQIEVLNGYIDLVSTKNHNHAQWQALQKRADKIMGRQW